MRSIGIGGLHYRRHPYPTTRHTGLHQAVQKLEVMTWGSSQAIEGRETQKLSQALFPRINVGVLYIGVQTKITIRPSSTPMVVNCGSL